LKKIFFLLHSISVSIKEDVDEHDCITRTIWNN